MKNLLEIYSTYKEILDESWSSMSTQDTEDDIENELDKEFLPQLFFNCIQDYLNAIVKFYEENLKYFTEPYEKYRFVSAFTFWKNQEAKEFIKKYQIHISFLFKQFHSNHITCEPYTQNETEHFFERMPNILDKMRNRPNETTLYIKFSSGISHRPRFDEDIFIIFSEKENKFKCSDNGMSTFLGKFWQNYTYTD